MARPRVASGALFTDAEGRILLVKPTYKDYWDIPGGYVEPGESPREACIREVREELGISPEISAQPLVIDWAPAEDEGDKILFVFLGSMTQDDRARITFQDGELTEFAFVDQANVDGYAPPRLARRLHVAVDKAAKQGTTYAEHGNEVR
jgi:8-oxo-dGTP diphosphatase